MQNKIVMRSPNQSSVVNTPINKHGRNKERFMTPLKSRWQNAVSRARALSGISSPNNSNTNYRKGSDFQQYTFSVNKEDSSFDYFDKASVTNSEGFFLQEDNDESLTAKHCTPSSPFADPNMMRNKYLSKLTQEKVWLTPSQKPKVHQSIIIFDWDDTLLWTTFLEPVANNTFSAPLLEETRAKLQKLEAKVWKLLSAAIERAQVFIITNAQQGWVEQSCKAFMPKVEPLLGKVNVISARSKYEKEFPYSVHEWKMHAFLETLADLEYGAITNIIWIGDSQAELDAGHKLYEQFPLARIKTIKFKQCPTPDELDKELKALLSKMNVIIDNGTNMSIKLEKKCNREIGPLDLESEFK
jgi:hypothetical protein